MTTDPEPGNRGAPTGPESSARRLAFVRRMALLCAVLVLMITSLSAFIRLSKAGLSCADWPACYGQGLRDLQQGRPAELGEGVATAAARLAHRIVATTALLLVIAILIACLTARPVPRQETAAALALLSLAVFLAVLGRWSSDARLPAVAMGNLLGGFAMLALCWRLAHRGADIASPGLRRLAWLGTALCAVQVALGGLLSASYAATSCPSGFSECLVAAGKVPSSALDPWREPQLASSVPIHAAGALALAVHWLSGIVAAPVLALLGLGALRGTRPRAGALLLAALAAALAVGWMMASLGTTLPLALAHNLVATVLLATSFELTRARRADAGETGEKGASPAGTIGAVPDPRA